MKNEVFFSEQGLTTTSANHIANLAKEKISILETEIDNLSFVKESVKLASSDVTSVLNIGASVDALHAIDSKLREISQYKCLIAWLREAIKAKEALTKEISYKSDEEVAKILEIELPEAPLKEHCITEAEVIDALPIKERNRYFTLETIAAVYGKAIHPHGAFSDARSELEKAISKPNKVYGQGRDMTIYTFTPTCSISEVDDTFFKLQTVQREAQAEFNGLKHKIQLEVVNQNLEVENKYASQYKEFRGQLAEFNAKKELWIHEQLEAVSKLKIAIPDSLKPTFEKVSKLGK